MTGDLPVIVAGALLGGFVNGLAGFGTGLFALGFWLFVLPPAEAVAMSVVVAAVTGLQGLWLVRREILGHRTRLFRFLGPALLGIPFGYAALGMIDAGVLRLIIAGFLVTYGLFFLIRRSLPRLKREYPTADIGIGAISGVLGGLAAMSGAILVMWCALMPWSKRETRAVLQPFNFTVLAIVACVFLGSGAYTPELLRLLVVALISALFAAQLGIFAFGRLSDEVFRWLIVCLMTLSGVALIVRTIS